MVLPKIPVRAERALAYALGCRAPCKGRGATPGPGSPGSGVRARKVRRQVSGGTPAVRWKWRHSVVAVPVPVAVAMASLPVSVVSGKFLGAADPLGQQQLQRGGAGP